MATRKKTTKKATALQAAREAGAEMLRQVWQSLDAERQAELDPTERRERWGNTIYKWPVTWAYDIYHYDLAGGYWDDVLAHVSEDEAYEAYEQGLLGAWEALRS
jgi:hypothetical protein